MQNLEIRMPPRTIWFSSRPNASFLRGGDSKDAAARLGFNGLAM